METQIKTKVCKAADCAAIWQQLQSIPVSSKDWENTNWAKTSRSVQHLRNRIFAATRRFNDALEADKPREHQKLRRLQRQALFSYDNYLLWATRRVTQIKKGKYTPGVDLFFVKTKEDRHRLVLLVRHHINIIKWEPLPARRTYIRKPNGKLRPLGIPTLIDRIIQAIYKTALEPEWEFYADIGSYGFRPGRSCHDALERIFKNITSTTNQIPRKRWVLDADITGCFDNISHDYLMNQIGDFPGSRSLIYRWLKAGYIDRNVYKDTDCGTPQGGIISPLLANSALDGLERELNVKYKIEKKKTFPGWRLSVSRQIPKNAPYGPRSFIRYADDFVVLCESKEDAELAKENAAKALKLRGLQISEMKSRISCVVNDGFDFLGVNVGVYKKKMIDRRTKNLKWGYKPLLKPSKESLKKARAKLKLRFLQARGKNALVLILSINSFLTGWANDFRPFVSKKAFAAIDAYIFYKCLRWGKRTHSNKGLRWIVRRYFGRHCPSRRNDRWVFFASPDWKKEGDEGTDYRPYLRKAQWTNIRRHNIVPNGFSHDDVRLKDFWEKRALRGESYFTSSKWAKVIAQKQRYHCPICRCPLSTDSLVQVHHIVPKRRGGDNSYKNNALLCIVCHSQIRNQEEEWEPYIRDSLEMFNNTAKYHKITKSPQSAEPFPELNPSALVIVNLRFRLEPYDGQLSRTVLRGGGGDNIPPSLPDILQRRQQNGKTHKEPPCFNFKNAKKQ
eukprot:TRINITY_DN2381_c0_g1_i5.p1 TRINITY_DN2381_c0_g1~~TRINITY_DN2381_c0_g1_i5.p1  ORF type:complete len:731 (-),score=16.67 TRINITY_DN2381_c0_g1_i5:373-2565(-)